MFAVIFVSLFAAAQVVSAHFALTYPSWRADTLSEMKGTCGCASQYRKPNRLASGGSVSLDLHHPWAYVDINLGLGENVADDFNVSLTPQLMNVTGKGNFCIPSLYLPESVSVSDGQKASIQVVTGGESGDSRYNMRKSWMRRHYVSICGQAAVRRGMHEQYRNDSDQDNFDSNAHAKHGSGKAKDFGESESGAIVYAFTL
ncbi:hypothetical protein F5B20DRAFT_584569 [Whalleya microplaca]|nr:hypothetical protein F5B20DRAFT_584569 [Whalleya microplaca]